MYLNFIIVLKYSTSSQHSNYIFQVVAKSYGLALLLMQAFVHISSSSLNSSFDDFLEALHDCVVKSLSSPVWDVRDTALTFIGSVYSTFPGGYGMIN